MAPNHAVRWNCLLCDLFVSVPMHCGVPSFPPENVKKSILALSKQKTNIYVACRFTLTDIVRLHLHCYYWRMALNYVHLQKWLAVLEYIPAKNIGYHCLDVLASFHRNRCHPRIETNVISWVQSVIMDGSASRCDGIHSLHLLLFRSTYVTFNINISIVITHVCNFMDFVRRNECK